MSAWSATGHALHHPRSQAASSNNMITTYNCRTGNGEINPRAQISYSSSSAEIRRCFQDGHKSVDKGDKPMTLTLFSVVSLVRRLFWGTFGHGRFQLLLIESPGGA